MNPTLIQHLGLDFNNEIKNLLNTYSLSGGAIDYVPIPITEYRTETSHKEAVIFASELISRSYKNEGAVHLHFSMTNNLEKLSSQPISLRDFWGTDDVIPVQILENAWSLPKTDGYKPAFYHPPHGMSLQQDEKDNLFQSINSILFGSSSKDCSIFEWTTNWSNYFDAGNEWWGSFLWSVYSNETKILTVLAVSATD